MRNLILVTGYENTDYLEPESGFMLEIGRSFFNLNFKALFLQLIVENGREILEDFFEVFNYI